MHARVAGLVGLAGVLAASAAGHAQIWQRERKDGIIESTNIRPVGRNWKVVARTGPGKASALRGTSDVVPARDAAPDRFTRYDADLTDQRAIYGVPVALLRAVIKTESDFDPRVVSSAGAKGLTQLMPDTARSMGVTDVFDPRQNIMGGARFIATLARRYCRQTCSPSDIIKVLAAYHAGPGAVARYGGMPPFETTRAYVTAVLARTEKYQKGAPGTGPGAVAEK